MTKQEFYDKIVNLYKQTGQGLMKFIGDKYPDEVKELLDEGKIKIVSIPFSTLPDSKFYSLTNVYCVEEDTNKYAFQYLRFYLGMDNTVDFNSDVNYLSWLNENKDLLLKIPTTPYYDGVATPEIQDISDTKVKPIVNEETLSYIYTFFDGGTKIPTASKHFEKLYFNDTEVIKLCKKAITLTSDAEKIKEYTDYIEESTIRSGKCKKAIKLLDSYDLSLCIKDIK